ncbi:MAG: GGDEF domain-containing protein [Actinomycetota bacterium]
MTSAPASLSSVSSSTLSSDQHRPPTARWVDGVALMLSAASATGMVMTAESGWVVLGMLALAISMLGAGSRRWLVLPLVLSVAGVITGFCLHVVIPAEWAEADHLGWGRAAGAIAVAGIAAWVVRGRMRRMHGDLVDAQEFARDATVHDELTGLPNRRGLFMLATQILESARRRGDAVYCMYLDVDGLAQVNDEYGHHAGDAVLKVVGQALTRSTRATDAVARVGGDEFVVIGPGTGLAPQEIERRVRTRCLEQVAVPRSMWSARISAGGAVLEPWDDGNIDTLLDRADREMHLRRTVRREAANPPYRPLRHDPSPHPPEVRR